MTTKKATKHKSADALKKEVARNLDQISVKKDVERKLAKVEKEAEAKKQPNLFGKKDDLMSALSTEIADLAARVEAAEKRIENAESDRDEFGARLATLRQILRELQREG